MDYTTAYSSPVGKLTIASDGASITGLWIEGQKYYGATLEPQNQLKSLPVFDCVVNWLNRYFAGENPAISFSLAPRGSAFRQEVWKILRGVPYGSVITYGDIAKRLAARQGASAMCAQAVGGAVGRNPISILIPCHRVVGSNGSLTGYAGGLDVKRKLLNLEKADACK